MNEDMIIEIYESSSKHCEHYNYPNFLLPTFILHLKNDHFSTSWENLSRYAFGKWIPTIDREVGETC